MNDFLGEDQQEEEKTSDFLGGDDTKGAFVERNTTVPENLTEQLSNYYSTALGKSSEEIKAGMLSGYYPMIRNEATQKAIDSSQKNGESEIDFLLQEKPEDAQERLDQIRSSFTMGPFIAPDIAALINENNTFNPIEKKVVERAIAFDRLVEAKRSKSTKGFWGGAGYLLDTAVSELVHSPLGGLEELAGKDTEKTDFTSSGQRIEIAKELSQLLYMDLSDEEFETRVNNLLDRGADTGLFSEENYFYLDELVAMAAEGGLGWNSDMSRVFQVLDTVTLDGFAFLRGTTKGVYKGLTASRATAQRAGRQTRRLAALSSREKAVQVTVKAGEEGQDTLELVGSTTPDILNPTPQTYFAGPEYEAMRAMEAENAALRLLKEMDQGDMVDPEVFALEKQGLIDTIKEDFKSYSRHDMNYGTYEGATGNMYGYVVLGNNKAAPYATKESAQALADKVLGVVQMRIVDGKEKFVVVKETDIIVDGLVEATDVAELAQGFLASLASTTKRTDPRWDAMLKRGEMGGAKAIREVADIYRAKLKRVDSKQRGNLNAIMDELNNDPAYSGRKEPYTKQEYVTRYTQKFHRAPTVDEVEYFQAVRDINDVDFYLRADGLLKEAISEGQTMIQLDDGLYRSKRVRKPSELIEEGASVWNVDTKKWLKVTEETDLENLVVYQVMDAAYAPKGLGRVRYVTKSAFKTRRLYHTDVLNYNAGGHRTYDEIVKFFVKQESGHVSLADGTKIKARDITFLGTRLEVQAKQAVDEFNNIVDAVKEGLSNYKINKVIQRNKNWNTSIESVADFRQFVKAHGLKADARVSFAPDGDPVMGAFKDSSPTTHAQSFRQGQAKARGAKALVGFGGHDLKTLDPTKAIERGAARQIAKYSDQRYMFNSINGWMKAALEGDHLENPRDLIGLSPKQAMRKANPRKTEGGAKLRAERRTIESRLSSVSQQVETETASLQAAAEYVYGSKRIPNAAGKTLDWLSVHDPAGFMRALAFHSKLGLFAVDQLYVQASQLVNIVGISAATLGPVEAMRGMLAVAPLRIILIEGLSDEIVQRVAKIQAPFSGISPEDFIQLRDWLKGTGRTILDKTLVEENNAAASIVRSKTLEWGQTFFNEGELLARLGAATNNLKERRLLYPNENIFDSKATDAMIRRQDVLAASMTSASAAPWQKNMAAIPLQFTTYHIRMSEQMFSEGILTAKEKAGLTIAHLFAWGAAAVPGAGYVMDKLAHEGTLDPTAELANGVNSFEIVRFGAIDAILSGITGEDTAIATRLAAGEGLFDFFTDKRDETLFEVAIGPSGSIAKDSIYALAMMSKNIFQTKGFDHVSYDWNRFARNISSYNRGYNLWMATNYGINTSRKTEATTIDNMSVMDGILKGLGVPLAEEHLLWTTIGFNQMDKKNLQTTAKDIQRLDTLATRAYKDGDIETAAKLAEDMGAILSVLSVSQREEVDRYTKRTLTMMETTMKGLIENGKSDIAFRLKELQSDE